MLETYKGSHGIELLKIAQKTSEIYMSMGKTTTTENYKINNIVSKAQHNISFTLQIIQFKQDVHKAPNNVIQY